LSIYHGIKILGIGNLVRRDEGVGVHLLRALENTLPPEIELLDGGTTGLNLLEFVENAQKLIVLDAVEAGENPGEVVVWRKEQVPYFIATKMSVHQLGFAEVLNWAKFREKYPEDIVVIGVQPQCLDWGTELSEPVQQALPAALKEISLILEEWGVTSAGSK
jgi:hydrogenase maturation protease